MERFVFLAGLVAAAVPEGRLAISAMLVAVAVAVAVVGVVCGWLGLLGAWFAWWA